MMEEAKGIETSSDEEETSRMEENKDMEVGDIGLSYSMDEDEDDNDNDNDNDNHSHNHNHNDSDSDSDSDNDHFAHCWHFDDYEQYHKRNTVTTSIQRWMQARRGSRLRWRML